MSAVFVVVALLLIGSGCGSSVADPQRDGLGAETTAVGIPDLGAPVSTGTTAEAAPGDRSPFAAVVDDGHCPKRVDDGGPLRIGVNGGGFNGSSHVEGLQAAFDEAIDAGGIGGRRVELVTAIERESDGANAEERVRELIDGGGLHAIVRWAVTGGRYEIADVLESGAILR